MLKKYTRGTDMPTESELKKLAYIEARNEKGGQLPDYVYKNNRKRSIDKCKSTGQLLNKSLNELAQKYLTFRNSKIFVGNKYFSQWQEVLCRVSPLSLIAVAIKKNNHFRGYSDEQLKEVLKINLRKTALPYPYLPLLEQLKRDEGLHELHIHLNGSTELDVIWQEALKKPRLFYEKIQGSQNKENVREQYLQVDEDIDENIIYQYLHLARKLRALLVKALESSDEKVDISLDELKNLMNVFDLNGYVDVSPLNHWHEHPIKSLSGEYFEPSTSILEQEAYFIIKVLDIIEKHSINAICLHVYFLIQNLINKYIVQQVNQFGFDQFQKITLNEYRELLEKIDYKKRFRQLEGMHGETLVFLEGRFAPKSDPFKIYSLLHLIIKDYKGFCNNGQSESINFLSEDESQIKAENYKKMILGLTGHFIKKTEKNPDEEILHICNFQKNRREYRRQAEVITYLSKEIFDFKKYVRGFDAAANEMHMPPEVFAPVFRYLKRNGFTDFTYHCGEDYVHLISGIRAIYESIKFLELGPKNRIGHGTAVGICPELWIKRAGENIAISRGEWLDNLIFCYYILRDSSEFQHKSDRIEFDIASNLNKIYGKMNYNMPMLINAWKYRSLDPLIACDASLLENKYECLNEAEFAEWEAINKAKENDEAAFELFQKYHTVKAIEKYEEIIEVKANYLSVDILYYLQEKILEKISKKNIAIESLPTSNVRISYYENHHEHHIYRWLTGKWKDKSGICPIVVLGSDDPGIFATSVQNEFAHVYELLKKKNIQERNIYKMLKEINDHSRAYAFSPEEH